jgi:hypothetical protein
VAIQYLPQYHARGYAVGVEFKINGEFVKDAESWATLSILETQEDVCNDICLIRRTGVSGLLFKTNRSADTLGFSFRIIFQESDYRHLDFFMAVVCPLALIYPAQRN